MTRSGGVERAVERLLRDGVDSPGGDARLLQRFLAERDPRAFEAIVDRHGPIVLTVCRRYLREPADVEDAFQATFLVLVRKASGLRDGDALASWLYGVAYRVALRARANALKRRAREGEREGLENAPAEPSRPADDAREALDAEMARLSEKFRAPLVLCYLKGKTHEQAAAELGWPVGTVRSRMARARALLRDRLARRGVDASLGLAAVRADVAAIPFVPSSLVAATASAAVRFAGASAGLLWLGASPSSTMTPAARLALGVLATMTTTPWKALGIAFACAGLTVGALASATVEAPGGPQDPPKPPAQAEQAPSKDVEGRLSDVERKLDRLIGLVESLGEKPAKLDDAARSSPPVSVEARTLREIEAQLVNVVRKYELVSALVNNARVPRSDLEDAIAPARVLVARLRGMEDEEQARLTNVEEMFGVPAGSFDDPARAESLAKDRFKEAKARLERAEAAWKEASGDDPKGFKFNSARDELVEARKRYEAVAMLQGLIIASYSPLQRMARPGEAAPANWFVAMKPTYAKLSEIRRLIAWTKAHVPDVELTIDGPKEAQGEDVGKPAPAVSP